MNFLNFLIKRLDKPIYLWYNIRVVKIQNNFKGVLRMNELKRLELILKQNLSEKITIEKKGDEIKVNCINFRGTIDLDKIILDNFDDGEFLKNSTFILDRETELIAEYQCLNVVFNNNCKIYVNTENSFENQIKITGKNNNEVKAGKNTIIKMNVNNEITCGGNCKITVEDNNLIEVIEDFNKICLKGAVEIIGQEYNRIILPLINSNENNIKVGKNSNISTKGYDISFI